jgi:hypothetical protein
MPATPCDLFRMGNSTSPRLDNVRCPKDIQVYQKNGADWVPAGGGGISTFECKQSWGGPWWRLPAGSAYDSQLSLINDFGNHWLWQPNNDMSLADYRAALASVNTKFIRA